MEKSKLKKVFAGALCLLLLLSFVGCAFDDTYSSDDVDSAAEVGNVSETETKDDLPIITSKDDDEQILEADDVADSIESDIDKDEEAYTEPEEDFQNDLISDIESNTDDEDDEVWDEFEDDFEDDFEFDDYPYSDDELEMLVWIPTNGGTKFHSRPNCSQMRDPMEITLEEALDAGFDACGRCW